MNDRVEEILENVVWLVNQCDDEALARRRDLPFLELAKYVSSRVPLRGDQGQEAERRHTSQPLEANSTLV
jgi:hypothetical protein